jgi:hypothetical protein
VWESATVLQLLVVTTCKYPIKPITNPNPVFSHCDTWQYCVSEYYPSFLSKTPAWLYFKTHPFGDWILCLQVRPIQLGPIDRSSCHLHYMVHDCKGMTFIRSSTLSIWTNPNFSRSAVTDSAMEGLIKRREYFVDLRQLSHSRVRAPRDPWPYFMPSDSTLPLSGWPQIPVIISPRNSLAQLYRRHWCVHSC